MNFDHETLQVDRETLKNLSISAPGKASRTRASLSSTNSSRSISISDSPVPLSSDSALKLKAHHQRMASVASDTYSSHDPLSSCSAPGTDDDIDAVDEVEPFSDLTSPKLAQNIEAFLRDNGSQLREQHSLTHQRQHSRRHHRKVRRGRSQTSGSAGLLLLPSESQHGRSLSRSGKMSPRSIVESESDDNDSETDAEVASLTSLVSPKADTAAPMPSANPALHLRSFSESHIHRDIQTTQWPSTDEDEGASDAEGDAKGDSLYQRYMTMKKKYQKQRRISRQFQEAITVIQDDNETEMASTEQSIRAQLAAQYEITMMRMEQQKLGKALQIENKLKSMERHNEELARHNQRLQTQVAQQVQIIQQQQMHQQQLQQQAQQAQAQVQAVQAVSTIGHAHAHGLLRRHSSAISAISALTASTTDEVEYTLNGAQGAMSPSEGAQSFGFTPRSAPRTPRTPRTCTPREESDMEMSVKYRKRRAHRRAMSEREMEARLLASDKEAQRVTGDGLSAWDRFLDLMTPAFCSCAPAPAHSKHVRKVKQVKVVD